MFAKNKQPPIRSLIGEGTVIQGELRFIEGLRIDGEVQGDVIATGASSIVVVSEKARIVGKIQASHIIVNGRVEGPIECDQFLELQPKASIVGDIRYEVLEMHQGATIDGELRPIKAEEKPALKLATANNG